VPGLPRLSGDIGSVGADAAEPVSPPPHTHTHIGHQELPTLPLFAIVPLRARAGDKFLKRSKSYGAWTESWRRHQTRSISPRQGHAVADPTTSAHRLREHVPRAKAHPFRARQASCFSSQGLLQHVRGAGAWPAGSARADQLLCVGVAYSGVPRHRAAVPRGTQG